MTSSLRRVLRSRRAIGAAAAAGVLFCVSLGLDVSLADASADAVDTAATEAVSANANATGGAAGGSSTEGGGVVDPGGGGAPTTPPTTAPPTTAPPTTATTPPTTSPTSTTVDDFGVATVPSTTAASGSPTTAVPTTAPAPSTTTATTTATTTTRPPATTTTRASTTSQTTTPDYLDGASVTVVAPIGGIGDDDGGMLPPPATISVPTTARPPSATTAVTQRGSIDTASVSKDQPLAPGATGAERLDANPSSITATTQPALAPIPTTTAVAPPTTEQPRTQATTPVTRPAVEERSKPLFFIEEIEAVRVGAGSNGGTTITLQLWGSDQRIGVELHPSRLPSLWVVWVVIALLLMAFWLPGKGRQPAVVRRSRR
ncbi:MAG: hypothetical protein AB7O92_03425 [Acidimicrobiia bacterium]